MGKTEFILLTLMSLHSVRCVFFHDQSAVLLKPGGDSNPRRDFGFSMEHWRGNLIVGSPSSNFIGEVYSCPVAAVMDNTENPCSIIEFNKFFVANSTYTMELNPNQNFYLGASISSARKLLLCAPLVTKRIPRDSKSYVDAFGTCFTISDKGKIKEYKGPDDRFKSNKDNEVSRMVGGYGWNTLADEDNDFFITAKTSVDGDINYSKISLPSLIMTSLSSRTDKSIFADERYLNIGYGLAAGKFFTNQTVYAFSVQTSNVKGMILFLKPQSNKLVMDLMSIKVTNRVVNAMFGYTLAAADLNLDGLSELLVGAPAHTDDGAEIEHGALHIYLGGDGGDLASFGDNSRMRTILGELEGGRFGTAVAASDIDGDSIPEIFVSAPYENTGQVYILSGFELNRTLISSAIFMQIRVSELKLTQKVQRSDMKLLGYSLQVVPDADSNGCDELAIGAPGKSSALLFKGLQHVNVTISSHLIGSQYVREKDSSFTVDVCLYFGYKSNSTSVHGRVSVHNYIQHSGAYIPESNFTFDLSIMSANFCKPITVKLTHHESTVYDLITVLKLESTLESKNFDKSWVVLSPYSETVKTLKIERRCDGDDCKPKLSMEIKWKESKYYSLGSSEMEAVTIFVKNEGFAAQSACLRVDVTGARVSRGINKHLGGGYEYLLPSPLGRNVTHPATIDLKMTKLSNMDTGLNFTARLYEDCAYDQKFITKSLEIPYSLEQEKKLVHLEGNVHDLQLTDKDIYDKKEVPLKDSHEYTITNNGTTTWKNVRATVVVKKEAFIKKINTTETNCKILDEGHQFRINYTLTLPAGAVNKIIVWVEMSKEEVDENLNKGQKIKQTAEMILFLDPTDYYLKKELVTKIMWKTDLTLGNNKLLIGLIAGLVALLVLALIYYILRKYGFFKRTQKKRLNVLRESVRKRSIRLASESRSRHTASASASAANEDHLDIEVMEDSAFEEIPVGTNDNVGLIESKAEVHSSDQPKANPDKRQKNSVLN